MIYKNAERTTGGLASVGRDKQTISFYLNCTYDQADESNSNFESQFNIIYYMGNGPGWT